MDLSLSSIRLKSSSMNQQELFDDSDSDKDVTRNIFDQLIADSKLYKNSRSYRELLDFVAKLRNVAPFNAMLLQIQKPGITYVASAHDWKEKFNRQPKEDARPLLILWPFAPVVTVYDFQDTEGDELPEDVFSFPSSGAITKDDIQSCAELLRKMGIEISWVDHGDAKAGSIRVTKPAKNKNDRTHYLIKVNRNHFAPTQFATIAHELAHLYLGHLGRDQKLCIPERRSLPHSDREIESESVAYLLCARKGIDSKAAKYLSNFITREFQTDNLDLHQIMKAAGKIEHALNLIEHTQFERPRK